MISEEENLSSTRRIYWWRPASWLKVTGPDAFDFLQGQLTNDLRAAQVSRPVYGLWLDRKGHVQADSFIWKISSDEWWVGSYFSPAGTIRQRLESFIVADDVTVEDRTSDWRGVVVFGNAVASGPVPADVPLLRWEGRRAAQPVQEWIFPSAAEAAVHRLWLDAPVLTADQMEAERIAAGIPAVPFDIGPGDLPNEGGLDTTAISYAKGCYLGQEVMARLKTMGQVRRRLFRIRGQGAAPSRPAALFQGERRVGELRSAAGTGDGFVGLALLSMLNLRPEAPLSFSPAGDPTVSLIPAHP